MPKTAEELEHLLTTYTERDTSRRGSWVVERLKSTEEKKRVLIKADEHNMSRIPLVKMEFKQI